MLKRQKIIVLFNQEVTTGFVTTNGDDITVECVADVLKIFINKQLLVTYEDKQYLKSDIYTLDLENELFDFAKEGLKIVLDNEYEKIEHDVILMESNQKESSQEGWLMSIPLPFWFDTIEGKNSYVRYDFVSEEIYVEELDLVVDYSYEGDLSKKY